MEHFVNLIDAVAWPIVIIVAIILMRSELRSTLGRVISARFPGGQVTFGASCSDKLEQAKPSSNEANLMSKADLSKSGNLYWLGHDIMWTIDAILRNAPREPIKHGLKQSIHHLKEIGLSSSTYETQLMTLLKSVQDSTDTELTPNVRQNLSSDLRRISGQLGAIAVASQEVYLSASEEKA